MLTKPFDPHLRVLRAVRAELVEHGFSFGEWAAYPHAVAEIPRPALFPSGDFRDIDLARDTSNFPHELDLPPLDAYTQMLINLRNLRPGSGRQLMRVWQGITSEGRTNVGAIMTPMRIGHYGMKPGETGVGYHVAEFVYLLHRIYPDASLVSDAADGNFYIELDGSIYGIVNGMVLNANGEMQPLNHEFDQRLLMSLRPAPNLVVRRNQRLWKAVGAFVNARGIDKPEFLQALSHARWSLPGAPDWFDRQTPMTGGRGRPPKEDLRDPKLQALRVKECIEMLERVPNLATRHVRSRLVPHVIPHDVWQAEVAPLTRFKATRHTKVLEYIRQIEIHQEEPNL